MSTPTIDRMSRGFPPGSRIGTSDWIPVTQEMINGFGAATLDPDPMHIDPRWAAANGPFGGAIAFGFLTIALLTHMFHSATGQGWDTDPAVAGYNLNYGFDRLRLVSPIPAGARVRGHFVSAEVRHDDNGRRITAIDCEIEIEGAERPALVGRWLTAWVPPAA